MINKKVLVLLCSLILSTASMASAGDIPTEPERFYGAVTVNGVPAEDGIVISAWISGKMVASQATIDGKYGYVPPASKEFQVHGEDGATIQFKVAGTDAITDSLDQRTITKLDISVDSIDEENPTVTLNKPVNGIFSSINTVTFNFTANDNIDKNVDYILYIDGEVSRTGTATAGEYTTLDVSDLADGDHSWYVKVEDDAGNVNASPACTFSVDYSSSGVSHSSGGGGSGGGGGSPEAQSNVEAKELSQQFLSNGKHVKFEFSQGATCIMYVEFDAKRTAGKTTTIAEMLKKKSGLVSELPAGTVYRNVNLWVGNGGVASSENIENAVIGFRVEKAWLEENGVDAADISLWHYDNGWSELETRKVGEDDVYVYFEADTPGFSPFVIVANGVAPEDSTPTATEILPVDSASEPENKPASEPEKSSQGDESTSGIPGFDSLVVLGILGAVYCMLRRKP